ncbi:MAG: RHS repeat-associated core domain-containing protein [Oscillospiraceae bacterium]
MKNIHIYCAYDYNSGTAWFDNISLRQEPVQTYAYNAKGNVSSVTQSDIATEKGEYASNGVDLTSYTAITGVKYSYTYNGKHDIAKEEGGGLTTTYTYDTSGNTTGSQMKGSDTDYTLLQSTMTPDRNHTASVTDTNGSQTSYTYNASTEQLTGTSTYNPETGKTISTNRVYNASNGRQTQMYIDGALSMSYAYKNGGLSSLTRKSYRNGIGQWQSYGLAKDVWGNTSAVTVSASTNGSTYSGTRTLASYTYAANNGNLTGMTCGNGDSISYSYDSFDRLIKTRYNDTGDEVLYTYNAEGSLAQLELRRNSTTVGIFSYEYDSLGRLIRSRQTDGTNTIQRTEHLYDAANRLKQQNYTVGNKSFTTNYTYSSTDGTLSSMKTAAGATINYTYDGLKRLQMAAATSGSATVLTTKYAYRDINGTQTTAQPQYYKVIQGNGDGLSSATILEGAKYTYDAAGNITKIQESISPFRTLAVYAYDKQSQLTGATYYTYSGSSTTPTTTTAYAYTYDGAGNILTEKKNGATVRTYTYGDSGWNDLLTKVNGTTIGYDAIGNPTNYYNGVKTMTNLTWVQGRQLKQLTVGGAAVSYTYDANGIRTEKSAGGVTYEYITQSGKLVREKATKGSKVYVMDFFYDNNGLPFAVNFSSDGGASFKTYYYVLNLQGDVVKLVNSSGTTAAQYTYDAWGTVTSILNANGNEIVNNTSGSAIAFWNPLTYRGYIRDIETGFYYLQSRYYDPVLHRFINADLPEYTTLSSVSTASANLFAYCVNNPVNLHDENGEWPSWAKKLVAVVAVAAAVVTATVVTVATFGAGSVAGVAMISATATLAARTTEVVALQVKKGKQEGKSTSQIVKDSFESVYDNGKRIVGFTPATKGASITFNHLLSKSVSKIFDETVTIRQTLKSTGGKVIPYAFAALAWVRTGVSIFSDDPVKRASQRGYTLK